MWLELSNTWIVILNVLGIPIAHLSLAWLSTQLPCQLFDRESQSNHKNMWLYEKVFRVKSWKKLLPDGAPWMGGFAKGKLESTEPSYLKRYIAETRRGEFSHWLQMIAIFLFVIWNPYPASIVIVLYSTFSNLPCILNLRYTRRRISRVLS